MSRWRVGKHRRTGYWLAFSEKYDTFRPATLLDEYQGAARVFDTWRDAMVYADEQARTMEIVLPRIEGITRVPTSRSGNKDAFHVHTHSTIPWRAPDTGVRITAGSDVNFLVDYGRELEGLALALLAAHVKEKK